MTALLLAEPEPAVRGFLERQLRNDGFDVVACERAEQLPRGKRYAAAYRARYHLGPGTWGAFAYDSLDMLASAIGRTHRFSGARLRDAEMRGTELPRGAGCSGAASESDGYVIGGPASAVTGGNGRPAPKCESFSLASATVSRTARYASAKRSRSGERTTYMW